MPFYHQLGKIPPKRHTQFRKEDGSLYYEHLQIFFLNRSLLIVFLLTLLDMTGTTTPMPFLFTTLNPLLAESINLHPCIKPSRLMPL